MVVEVETGEEVEVVVVALQTKSRCAFFAIPKEITGLENVLFIKRPKPKEISLRKRKGAHSVAVMTMERNLVSVSRNVIIAMGFIKTIYVINMMYNKALTKIYDNYSSHSLQKVMCK